MTRRVSKNSVKASLFKMPFFLAVLFLFTGIQTLWAETYIWTGGNGDWATATNWTPNGVPGTSEDDIVYIRPSVSPVTINLGSAGITLDGISLGENGLSDDFSVTLTGTGTLTVKGNQQIGTNIADKGIVTYRPTNTTNDDEGKAKTSSLVIDCNVESTMLAVHSGGNVTIAADKIARITNVNNMAGSADTPTIITVNGSLAAETITLANFSNQELVIDNNAFVSVQTLNQNSGTLTNNGGILFDQPAGINVWLGREDSTWDNPLNWSLAKVPDPSTDKIKIAASTNPPVIAAGNTITASTTDFIIDDYAEVIVNGILELNGDFTLDERIKTSSTGKLSVLGSLSLSSAYSAPNLDIECASFSASANLTCKNLSVTGATTATGTVTLETSGATGISLGAASSFENITFSSGTKVTTSSNITVTGSWTNNGSFTANAGAVSFTSTSNPEPTVDFKGSGTNTFYDLVLQRNIYVQSSNTINHDLIAIKQRQGDFGNISFYAGTTQTVAGQVNFKGIGSGSGQRQQAACETAGSTWNLECTGPNNHVFEFVNLNGCNNISGYPIVLKNSRDTGSNINFTFPGLNYKWTGNTSSNWNTASNWAAVDYTGNVSVPGPGAVITIPKDCSNYPVLPGNLDLTITFDATSYGSITIEAASADPSSSPGTLDLAGYTLKVLTLTNNGLVKLNGIPDQIDGVISNGAAANSSVEYYGSGNLAPGDLAWGTNYKNLIINKPVEFDTDISLTAASITGSGPLTVTDAASLSLNCASVTIEGNQTYEGNLILVPTGKVTTLESTGTGSQILLKGNVSTTNTSSLRVNSKLVIGNNGGSGINVGLPLTVYDDVTFYSDNTLSAFTASGLGGKTLTFEKGKTQTVTGQLTLSGNSNTDDNRLELEGTGSGTSWNLTAANYDIQYVKVSDSTAANTLYANNSIDNGNNVNWVFPNMEYTWTGNTDTNWSLNTNWSPASVPGLGAVITIPSGTVRYPKLTENVVLDNATYKGSLTIENGASLNTNNNSLTVQTITNEGNLVLDGGSITAAIINNNTVEISGGSISGTKTNGSGSKVVYKGADPTNPVWGTLYNDLEISSGKVEFTDSITVNRNLINNAETYIANAKSINVKGDVTSTGDITGGGTLNFNGSSDQTFAPNNMSYPAVTTTSDGSLTISGDLNAVSVNTTCTTYIADSIITTGNQTYSGAVELNGDTSLNAPLIQFSSAVDGGPYTLTTNGTLQINNTVNVGTLAATTANIKGDITTSIGGQTYSGPVTLQKNAALTAPSGQLVKFESTLSGAYSLQISDADSQFDGAVNIASLITANADINSSSITTTGSQVYNGAVTLSQNNTTFKGTSLTFAASVASSSTGSGRTIIFDRCTAVDNSSASVSADISYLFDRTSGAAVTTTFTPGSSSYHDITSQNITLNIGDNVFTQDALSTFTISSGTVNMGNGGVRLGNLTVNGGTFRQTGEADDSVNNITFNSGTISWDSSDAGGTLAINGTIGGANADTINYHHKEVTINSTQSINGLFWSLVIPAGVTVTNADSLKIRKNLTIESTGFFAHNDKTLTFGNDAVDGSISDNNSSLVNLGRVEVNKTSSDSKVSAATNLLFTDLTITRGSFEIPSGKTVESENLTIVANGKLANAATLNISKDMTDSGAYSGEGILAFTGNTEQNFTPNTTTDYSNIRNSSTDLLNINANIKITNLSDTNVAKDISFNNGGTIYNDTILNTPGIVTFNQTVNFGQDGDKTFEHKSGDTIITGTVNAAIVCFEDLQLNGNVAAKTELYGSLTTSTSPAGSATFTGNVFVLGDTDAELDAPVNAQTNFIIQKDSGKAVSIKQNLDVTENFALYSGDVKLKANITTGKDVILLGSNYATSDPSTGYTNTYAYNTPRPTDWSQPSFAGFSDSIKAGSLEADAGTIIHAGKNFYANGTSLTGTAEWFIDILSNADSHLCFAEAYNSTFSNCTVRKHSGGTSAEEDDENAQIMAEACTIAANCKHFDKADFEIEEAWTTRDNVVYVKFNRAVRNLHGELNGEISNFKYYNAAECDTSYSSFFINADGSTALEDGSEVELVYLKSQDDKNWNTDATGTNAGLAKSTDRKGNHKTAVPYIDIPRATASASFIITDRFGKRLKHYSGNSNRITSVLDKTGPVLVEVRTGQETHETSLAAQTAYDAHNFIEFIYSEAVFFGNHADTINTVGTQNIQVTNALGIVTSTLTSDTDLTFAGIGVTIENGQMQTRKAGVDSDDSTMNAMYRDSTHSLKISLAGYAENVSSDGSISGTYIKWPGYIEQAVLPQGEVSTTATPASPNTVVTDTENNQQIMQKTGLTVNNSQANGTNYGVWDTQSPVFVKVHKHGEASSQDYYEALGNGDGSTLNRIEIHISDNPSSAESYNKYWLTGYGWTSDPSGTLLDPAADNLVGGSRPFTSSALSNATKGGLRYCTILNQNSAFKYEVGESDSPSQSFTAIEEGASAPFFAGASDIRQSIPSAKDNTYISLSLSDTSLPYKTTFTISYDASSSYITDLAGNRLKAVPIMKTLDLTSPDYKVSFSPVKQNKIFLIFLKQLTKDIKYDNNSIPESFEEIIPHCFELGTISGNTWTANTGTALQINTSVPASIIKAKSNSYFTAVELTLNRDVTMDDVEKTYIRLKEAGTLGANTYEKTSKDPITGLDNSYVSFIQDDVGNYMPMYQAHALSDFAVNMINPLYAYNDDIEFGNENLTYSLYEPGTWAVHDWNKEQQNYGTLLAQEPVTIISDLETSYFDSDGDNNLDYIIRLFYSNNPTAGSESDKYNTDIHDSLRLWVPENPLFANNGLFPAYAADTNQNFGFIDAVPIDVSDISKGIKFNFDETIVQNFKHGNQVSFLFGLLDGSTQKSICLNPVLTMSGGNPSYNVSAQVPLYLIRLKNPADITSLDLWSFRLKDIAAQRGNVSVMNNVINAENGEKLVIKVNLPQRGKLNVMIMTLDGSIVTYLNRGESAEGEYYYSWNGTNRSGKPVARGMYFVRVTGPGIDETRKVLVVK